MDRRQLKLILVQGEGYKVEFKEGIGGLEKDLVAFANSSGGTIFLGVTDDGKIKGIQATNRLKSRTQDIANNCKPRIQVRIESLDGILIINVREGEDKPYECSSGFYRRIGSNSQKMTRNEIIDCLKTEGKIRFDGLMVPNFKYPRDFDRKRLSSFLGLAGLSKSTRTETALLSLGVAEKQDGELRFSNSGVLFFAREPQRFVPWSVFTVVLFKDTNGVDVIDRKEITGSLFEIVDSVMGFVKLYAKVAYRFTGRPQREEIYEYPFEAIREAVINSVMHKDYFERGHNNILKFFPDRIWIENIWIKPRRFVVGRTVFRRNHIIADLFSRIDFGERIGSGMQRMKDICKAENAPYPRIEYTDIHFYITFKPSREYLALAGKEEVGKKAEIVLNERQRKAIYFVRRKRTITNTDYQRLNRVHRNTATKDLEYLVKAKILKRTGYGRGSSYELS